MKRKRGQRSRNKFPAVCMAVEEISDVGEPVLSEKARPRFASVVDFLVREKLDCSIEHWKFVPDKIKDDLWKVLKKAFSIPEDW